MNNTTQTKAQAIIKKSWVKKGKYDARIETIIYDHSPRNSSLPVISTVYGEDKKPTEKRNLTQKEAVEHIRSFGFHGEIVFKD